MAVKVAKPKAAKLYVEIVETATGKIEHAIEVRSGSPRDAERVERGAEINLNHAKYHTRIARRTPKRGGK